MEAVSNLAVHEHDIITGTAIISWDPPYTLQGVPILSYIIESSQCSSQITTTEDTSVPIEYGLDTYNLHPHKTILQVTVKPKNSAGEGKATVITQVQNVSKGIILIV